MTNEDAKARAERIQEELRLEYLRHSQERCRRRGQTQHCVPVSMDKEQVHVIRRKSRELYVYSNASLTSVMESITRQTVAQPTGVLLFDERGHLIRWYGSMEFWDWCTDRGIRVGTSFLEESMGTNAVALGLMHNTVFSTIGSEHYAQQLQEAALYFSPVVTNAVGEKLPLRGGVAILVPQTEQSPFLQTLINSVAREIELQFFWFFTIGQYDTILDGNGSIRLDQSLGRNRILVISPGVIKVLGLPKEEYFYRDLEDIVDPLPANQELWDIISGHKTVLDRMLHISCGGKSSKVSINTYQYLAGRFHIQGIVIAINSVQRINKLLSQYTGNIAQYQFEDIVGHDPAYLSALDYAKAASKTSSNILLLGESGVGKDIVAQAIHNSSDRRNQPFVAINCAAFSKELISSELFGYEEGAFTGARRGGNIGKFELANHGTLFLDEIGDMPLELQAVLLRVVENQCFIKMGGTALTHVDVRIIAATNIDLLDRIHQRMFREDLYYRIGVIRITIPPLRERTEDIMPLVTHFLQSICAQTNRRTPACSPDAKKFLMSYGWPGNVRELRNLVDGLVQLNDVPVIEYEHIVRHLMLGGHERDTVHIAPEPISRRKATHTRQEIVDALSRCGNNRSEAAILLGISRKTLYRRLDELGIQ